MDFLKNINEERLTGVAFKTLSLKKGIIRILDLQENATIADFGKALHISTPKITSTVNELIEEGLIIEIGKIESTGGRRANVYGLGTEAGFFMGVEVTKFHITIGLMDFKKKMVRVQDHIPFQLNNTDSSLQQLIQIIKDFIQNSDVPVEKILRIGINLTGRINHATGYNYNYFHFTQTPLGTIIEKETGIKTYIDNDSRAMAFGEYCCGVVEHEKNILFINLGNGVGLGIIINGEIYYGKSGFSGEFGHIPFFDNEIICQCGKKGCLETEASGYALVRMIQEKLETGYGSILLNNHKKIKDISLEEIVAACNQDDMLAIECMATIGEKLGKAMASLMNIFNPELVILGGLLSTTNEYLRLPIQSSLNKYSSSLVNNDTPLKISKLGQSAGIMGACLLVRNSIL